jgi:hypothetical protein
MSRTTSAIRRPRREGTPPPAPPARSLPGLALNDRLVRERDRDRARELLRTLALGIAILLPLLLHVWQQVTFVETAYRVADLRGERAKLQEALREMRLERASLEALDRIEARARAAGLVPPPPEAVVRVGEPARLEEGR